MFFLEVKWTYNFISNKLKAYQHEIMKINCKGQPTNDNKNLRLLVVHYT